MADTGKQPYNAYARRFEMVRRGLVRLAVL